MKIHSNIIQGSPEWLALRASCDGTASEAPAMMGHHKQTKRNELLFMRATGSEKEFSEWFREHILERGHRSEAAARPIAEDIIGEDLSPATVTEEFGDLTLLASMDGMGMEAIWEHKDWNEDLAAAIRAFNQDGTPLDPHYTDQLDQQQAVTGIRKTLFMCSNGKPDQMEYCWYETTPEKIEDLLMGWRQFRRDKDNYVHVAEEVKPIGKAPEVLPVVRVEVSGVVEFSNLDVFREVALRRIAEINQDPKTDEEIADAEETIKWCEDAEKRLVVAEGDIMNQTGSIDTQVRILREIKEVTRQTRLNLSRIVENRKSQIKMEVLRAGQDRLKKFVADLNATLGSDYIVVVPDFAGVMKNKRTQATLRNAVDTEAARCEILATKAFEKIQANLEIIKDKSGEDYAHLFPDTRALVQKEAEDLIAVLDQRISKYKADQDEKKRKEEAEAAAKQAAQPAEAPPVSRPAHALGEVLQAATPAPVAEVMASANEPAAPAPVDDGAMLTVGEISRRLGLVLTTDFLARLGFTPSTTIRAAKLYKASEFPAICRALAKHILEAAEKDWRAAA